MAEHPSSDAPCAQLLTLLDPCSQHASQKTPKGIHTHTTTADRWRARLRERTRAKEEGVDVRATVRGFRPPRATQSQLRFPEEFLDHLVPWEVLPGGFVVVG